MSPESVCVCTSVYVCVCFSVCQLDLSWLNHVTYELEESFIPVQGVCQCVCNQWMYADNHMDVVDQLLIISVKLLDQSIEICWSLALVARRAFLKAKLCKNPNLVRNLKANTGGLLGLSSPSSTMLVQCYKHLYYTTTNLWAGEE